VVGSRGRVREGLWAMMLPERNSATPSTACNAVGDSILVQLGQRNINVERKGGRTNGWWEWLMSDSGVTLPLLSDNVGSYIRTESGKLDLSLCDA